MAGTFLHMGIYSCPFPHGTDILGKREREGKRTESSSRNKQEKSFQTDQCEDENKPG